MKDSIVSTLTSQFYEGLPNEPPLRHCSEGNMHIRIRSFTSGQHTAARIVGLI